MSNEGTGARRLPYGEGRQALVEAAIRLVAREGFQKLTYRSLTQEAGVTQGSLRHHFPNLIGVIEAALENCFEVSRSYMRQPQDFLGHLIGMIEEHPEIPAFITEVYVFARHEPELLEVMLRHQEHYHQRVRTLLEAEGFAPDDELIDVMLAIGDGMVYQRVVFGERHAPVTERQVSGTQHLLKARQLKGQAAALARLMLD